jgi:hypothetical protein
LEILLIYFFIKLSISESCLSKFSKLSNGTIFGPSEGALSGSWCVSINTPATPTATAALAKYSTNSLCPPLCSPRPPGC